MKNYCSSRREHADRIENLQIGPLTQLTSKFNKVYSKKDFRKKKEILTCPVGRHKSEQKKKKTFEPQPGFQTIQCSEC
jgi:hypothetical protein